MRDREEHSLFEKVTDSLSDTQNQEQKMQALRNLDAARHEISQYLPDDFNPEKELEEARAERYAGIG